MMIVKIIIVFLIVIFSVILHELAHGVVAFWLGDRTAKEMGRLSFNPLKHIDPYMSILVPVVLYMVGAPVFGGAKPVPINTRNLKFGEWGMSLVAVAGPLMNFFIALGAFLVGHFTGLVYTHSGWEFLCYQIILTNLGFMIFNLLPIPPLDGSRILYTIVPDGVRNFLMMVEQYGIILIYVLILGLGPIFSDIMINSIEAVLRFFYWIVGA